MAVLRCLVALSLASIAVASPFQVNARPKASSPCARVSASVAAQSATATPTVPAQLAYDCITSVPINKTAALDLIDTITPYLRWQSNMAWLKNPPKEYAEKVQPGWDVFGQLDKIHSKVKRGSFSNEFEFGWAMYRLLQQTHDGHLVFVPDVIGNIFNWARPVSLVSISEDGKALPKPFVYPDILASSFGNTSFKPSAISSINGQKASKFLEDLAQFGSLQDRDALYNNVFYNLAAVSIGSTSTAMGTFAGSGRGRAIYPGAETKLKFENGTRVTYTNYAFVMVPFKGITDGSSLYKTYFTSPKPKSSSTSSSTSSTTVITPTPAPGYPPPVFREPHNLIGGYYLDTDAYADIAVLSVPNFVSQADTEIPFQQTAEKFLAAAKAAGKTKLIIDVSANGGGTILQGYDLYKQLFPSGIDHAAGDRFRAHQSVDVLGQKFSAASAGVTREIVDPKVNAKLYALQFNVVAAVLNYKTDLRANDTNFSSWADKYGPVKIAGDRFSNIIHWNLSDSLTPFNSGGIYIHGHGQLKNFTQPFAAKDIVVVTDGYCASTCAIFSELMRQRQGVQFISLGGRARAGLTQAVGGVKGTEYWSWEYIQSIAQAAITDMSTPAEGAALNKTELGDYWSTVPFDRQAGRGGLSINFRDGWRDADLKGGDAQFPLQFLYEEADCRILYTKEMTVDVTAIWKAVADSSWGAKSKCVAGKLKGGSKRYRSVARREVSAEERALQKRAREWKRSVKVEDFPLDLYTDWKGHKISADGYMFP